MGPVEVWATWLDSCRFDGAVCSDGEHDRAAAFGDRAAAARWLAARHFLRLSLATRLGRAPAALEFAIGTHGKPAVDGAEFSLAHSRALAVVAMATHPVGVDVEVLRPIAYPAGVARRLGITGPVTDDALVRAWCRAEALVKATGDGATRGLARVEARLGAMGWSVAELPLGPTACGAVAARGGAWTVVGPTWLTEPPAA